METNFFSSAPDPGADPSGFSREQQMAKMLMRGGTNPQQGQMAGGQFVPPSNLAYANQGLQGLAGAYKMNQLRDSTRASDILQGGTGQTAMQTGLSNAGTWIKGLFGGA